MSYVVAPGLSLDRRLPVIAGLLDRAEQLLAGAGIDRLFSGLAGFFDIDERGDVDGGDGALNNSAHGVDLLSGMSLNLAKV